MSEIKEYTSTMRPDVKDPVGMSYEDVTIVAEAGYRIGQRKGVQIKYRVVLLRCTCGKEFKGDLASFLNHKIKRCRSCGIRLGKVNPVADEDLVGMRFGMLTVTGISYKDNRCYAVCKCDCGNTSMHCKGNLTLGRVISCGCHRNKMATKTVIGFQPLAVQEYQDRRKMARSQLIGKKFGKLTIIEDVGTKCTNKSGTIVKVQCECGKVYEVRLNNIVNGGVKMCRDCRNKKFREDVNIRLNQLIGKRFGKVVVLEPVMNSSNGEAGTRKRRVKVQCDCGEIYELDACELNDGVMKQCRRCSHKAAIETRKRNREVNK